MVTFHKKKVLIQVYLSRSPPPLSSISSMAMVMRLLATVTCSCVPAISAQGANKMYNLPVLYPYSCSWWLVYCIERYLINKPVFLIRTRNFFLHPELFASERDPGKNEEKRYRRLYKFYFFLALIKQKIQWNVSFASSFWLISGITHFLKICKHVSNNLRLFRTTQFHPLQNCQVD